jgi:transcription termination factor Rho
VISTPALKFTEWNYLKRLNLNHMLLLAQEHAIVVPDSITHRRDLLTILARSFSLSHQLIAKGTLDVSPDGFGYLRFSENSYMHHSDDIYVSSEWIKRYGLRTGDEICGTISAPRGYERYWALNKITHIQGILAHPSFKKRPDFDDLTPVFPSKKINMEVVGPLVTPNGQNGYHDYTLRIIDILAPLGMGQRALVVAPPRTGKTILLKNIAHGIASNHPNIHLMVLLIDERPEEVTDMIRSVRGEVLSSTFDESASRHIRIAEFAIEKAKRWVESGQDVVILLDSITRLGRAYNTDMPSSGKILTGGIDANALQRPKRLFGAARAMEEGGSLTIIATALVDTGSKMDEVIFEEFKGTGNGEIVLERKCAEQRIFPALNLLKTGTRNEELLIVPEFMSKIWVLRRLLSPMTPQEAIEFLINKMKLTADNRSFFALMNR